MTHLVDKPKASVLITTYNHEPFIAQAIDSALMQRTNFDYEIIIGEDCSVDSTREIVVDYQKKHPDKIRLSLTERNLGNAGGPNFVRALQFCRGQYIAMLEGDDYWTLPHKLQKQVGFLESNPAYSGCAHQVLVKSKEEEERSFRRNIKPRIDLKDLLDGRLFHTASFVCRAEILKSVDWPIGITSMDQLLFIWVASHGPIRFFEEPMCVYRKHEGGISSWVSYDILKSDLAMIPWLEKNIPGFPKYEFLSYIHKALSFSSGISLHRLLKHYALYTFYSFAYFPRNLLKVGKVTLLYFPCHFWDALTK
jgi:glycosyltransferase involved in cell wall biosynthesis